MLRCVVFSSLLLGVAAVLPEGGGSVYVTSGAWRFVPGAQDPAAVAWGYYKDMASGPTVSGFGQLSISTSSAFNDTTQMFGAGYLEAALTQERIWSHTCVNLLRRCWQ